MKNIVLQLTVVLLTLLGFFSGLFVFMFVVESAKMGRYFDTYAIIAAVHFVFPTSVGLLLYFRPQFYSAFKPIRDWLEQ